MNFKRLAAVVLIVGFTVLGVHNIVDNQNQLHLKNIQIKSKAAQLKALELKYEAIQKDLDKSGQINQEQLNKLQELEKQKAQLEKELSIKRSKLNTVATSVPGTAIASAATNCGSDPYMAYIYLKESGCSVTALNSQGCRGIGQACPGDKLPCGADFACQDAFFRSYAISRYGSTYNAYLTWLSQHWW